MDPWNVGLVALIVIGLGAIVFGALWDRRKNARLAREMLSPPSRTIPRFSPDAPAPHYLSDLQARRRSPEIRPQALSATEREAITRQIQQADTVTVRAGYASTDFVTDSASSWAVLDEPTVLVCADEVASIRELLGLLEAQVLAGRPLALVAPGMDKDVLATLEVNAVQQKLRVVAVTADADALRTVAATCGAQPTTRGDRQSGYLPSDQLGRCARWISTPKTTHLVGDQPGDQ